MKINELWEIRIGFLNVLVAAISLIASVFIYMHGVSNSIEQEHSLIDARMQEEYKRKMWDEKRASYRVLAETLGEISANIEMSKSMSELSLRKFYKAYWGTLILSESKEVQFEMVKLKNDIRDLKLNRISSDKIKLRIQRIVTLSKGDVEGIVNDKD